MRLLTEQEPVSMNDGSIKPLNEVASGETYTLPTATATRLGGVKVGDGLSVTSGGVLSADAEQYTLPAATAETLGGVKVGDGLSVTEDGTLSASGGGGGSTKYSHNMRCRDTTWGGFGFNIFLDTSDKITTFAGIRTALIDKVGDKVINASGYYSGNPVVGISFSLSEAYAGNMHVWYIRADDKVFTYTDVTTSNISNIDDVIMEV